MVWVPRGFGAVSDFLEFLKTEEMQAIIEEGRAAVVWRKERTLEAMETWNEGRRLTLEKAWGVDIPKLEEAYFINKVGPGQPSFVHLAECLHSHILPFVRQRAEKIKERIAQHCLPVKPSNR